MATNRAAETQAPASHENEPRPAETAQPTLDLLADLANAVEGQDVRVSMEGNHLRIRLPNWQAGASLFKVGPFHRERVQQLMKLDEALRTVGLTADVQLDDILFARLGAEAHPGTVSRLLRLGAMEVHPARPYTSPIRRHPVVATAVLAGVASIAGTIWFSRRFR